MKFASTVCEFVYIVPPLNLDLERMLESNAGFIVALFPGSPSFRAIIPRMTFDPPEGKAFPSGGSKVIRRPEGRNHCMFSPPVFPCECEFKGHAIIARARGGAWERGYYYTIATYVRTWRT